MDLEYSEDERQIAQGLQRAFDGEDRIVVARRAASAPLGYDEAERLTLARGGWLGLALGAEAGAIGRGGVGTMLLAEACGRNLAMSPWLPDAILAASLLAEARRGVDAAANSRLDAILNGEQRIALATSEGDDDDARAPFATEAIAQPDGGFRIDGAKTRVLAAAGVDALIVSASVRAEGESAGLFLVAADAPGLTMVHERMIDGRVLTRVDLSAVGVAREARVDDGTNCARLLAIARDRALLAAAAENLGAMQVLFDATLAHVKTRRQFGQPIGSFQVLQHRLVDLSIRVDEARALVTAAAIAVDEAAEPGASPSDASVAVAAAWIQSLRSGRQIVEESIQMHGAIGMTDEYALGHYAKRIVLNEALFGAIEPHLTRFVSLSALPSRAGAATRRTTAAEPA